MQLTLENSRIQIGSQEVVRCRGCEKPIIRNKGSLAFGKEGDEYFYCTECQRKVEKTTIWAQGVPIRKLVQK